WGPLADTDVAEAMRLAKQAIETGKDDPDALWTTGITVSVFAGEAATAASLIERALTLNPNCAPAWMASGWSPCFLPRAEAAIEGFERAIRLSPLDPLGYAFTGGLAIAQLIAGHYEEAMEWVDRSLREQDRFFLSVCYKVALCGLLDRVDEGREWLGRLLELRPEFTIAAYNIETGRYIPAQHRSIISDGLRKAGLPEGGGAATFQAFLGASRTTHILLFSGCSSVRPLEQGVQEHVAAGGQVFWLGVLDLVVADTADAGHEDHRRGCDARHVDGVVAGAADDVLMPVALRRRRVADRGNELGMERGRRKIPKLLDLDLKADRRGSAFTGLPQVPVHGRQHCVFGVPEIDGKEHPARDRVA